MVLIKPWVWKLSIQFVDLPNYNLILSGIFATVVGIINYRFKGKLWQLLFCTIFLSVLSNEIMFYITYLKGYYMDAPLSVNIVTGKPAIMYREYPTYFSLVRGYTTFEVWINKLAMDLGIWALISLIFLFLPRKHKSASDRTNDIID